MAIDAWMKRLWVTLAISPVAAVAAVLVAAPAEGVVRGAGGPDAVAGSYLVIFKDAAVSRSAVAARSDAVTGRLGGRVEHVYRHALRGFELSASPAAARRIAADPSVRWVTQNKRLRASDVQAPAPSWGLDRIDQRELPLDDSYTYPRRAGNVRAYILDTGIRLTHQDFGGRAVSGFDAIDGGAADDCHGHGTHVAGTVGGEEYGVAKGVTLVAVRVLDCAGEGTTAQVVAGIDWVTGDHGTGQPAVANMSLGGDADDVLDAAVAASIADGVSYAISAGNDDLDACTHSPARTPTAITVGATGGYLGGSDDRAWFSNYGDCVDIFAPGVNIVSDVNDSDTATDEFSGTSMAAPHVTGAAALLLARQPALTPRQVRDHLVVGATVDVVGDPGPGSPNALLFNDPPEHDFTVSVSPGSATVDPGGSATTTVTTATTVGDPQVVRLSLGDLPSGVTATITPSSVLSGASATLRVTAAATVLMGTYPIVVTGTGDVTGLRHRGSYALVVSGPAGCAVTKSADLEIPESGPVESAIPIHGCAGHASPQSTVRVHIVHSYRGDLVVDLVAPDGTAYLLHDQTGGSEDDLDLTATLDLSGELAEGVWRLRIEDMFVLDTGHLSAWALNLAPPPPPPGCTGTNPADVLVPDSSTVTSAIPISGCGRNASSQSTVEVHIVHDYRGDLVVDLVAPDGTAYPLHDRAGGGADNLDLTVTLNLSDEVADGVWRLRVEDAEAVFAGYLDSWTLRL
ncbi:S8 family serine peptidase [Actinoplanes regularis]|uniref:Serine protease, subtilisin family n=1 Tax=Actinoplanes regularis TaxID=52697 RepID=A0A239FRD0_9ACTN|nr:S8 family serine peptidase [Actinoplanes regularis]GIE90171.1 hypothetical protein Are01nite_66510 [Actinoplanes regularis]SNS59410.1 Serine protease, subtilisin family [Actinoplanes regularis]